MPDSKFLKPWHGILREEMDKGIESENIYIDSFGL